MRDFRNVTHIYYLWLFSHDGKVRILNRDSRCASWIMIWNTVFWTVCTPNHVEIRDLRRVTRKHLWTVIWDAHLKSRISTWFGVHTVQITVFRIVILDAHLESRFKIRTLPSCENSLSFKVICQHVWRFYYTRNITLFLMLNSLCTSISFPEEKKKID